MVLLDLGLQNHDSLRLTATVHSEIPEAKVIVMGLLPLQEHIAGYVKAGAPGFIMKDASLEDFLMTIRRVAEGADVLHAAADNKRRRSRMLLSPESWTSSERPVLAGGDLLTMPEFV